jgi:hypothetical protein
VLVAITGAGGKVRDTLFLLCRPERVALPRSEHFSLVLHLSVKRF